MTKTDNTIDADDLVARIERLEHAQWGRPAATLSASDRQARIVTLREQIAAKGQACAALVAASGDDSLGRSPQSHILGGHQAAEYDELTAAIGTLERELAGLEG